MSTGWIKMGTGLRNHPKVTRMARLLIGEAKGREVTKRDRVLVVGALHAVWSVFDEHSPDGLLEGYSLSIMDEEIGIKGFCRCMAAVGWLTETDEGLEAPDYEEHNGPSAKRRALESKRKADSRAATDDRTKAERVADWKRNKSGQTSASDADKLRAREEGEGDKTPLLEGGANPTTASPAGAVCRAIREAGIPNVSPSHPTLQQLLAQGAQLSQFVDAAPKAKGKSDPFSYLLGVVKGQLADAAQVATTAPAAPADPTAWTKTRTGLVTRAAELGIDGFDEIRESHDAFRRRVIRAHNERIEAAA